MMKTRKRLAFIPLIALVGMVLARWILSQDQFSAVGLLADFWAGTVFGITIGIILVLFIHQAKKDG